MGFSQTVQTQALVAAARHCCVCHRYQGVNVEVHHIVPESEGGPDTFDNAIVLCFDCHANAGHYNPLHPRGKRYSPHELKRARDEWYRMVREHEIRPPPVPSHVLEDLTDWMKVNLGGYRPTYEEFMSGFVDTPHMAHGQALNALNEGRDLLVLGEPASGKTVFGVQLALRWKAGSDAIVLVGDFTELETNAASFVASAKNDFAAALTHAPTVLVLLDNVHTNVACAKALRRSVRDARRDHHDVQLILLARVTDRTEEGEGFEKDHFTETVRLVADEEAFRCVAQRLLRRAKSDRSFSSIDATEWVSHCGRDLVAFAVSFDPWRPASLSRTSISQRVNEAYITPAARQQGGLESFLMVCALSAIDLSLEDLAALGAPAEALYPQFIDNGTIIRSARRKRDKNPRRYCRLFHPSLGELIFKVYTNFSQRVFQEEWIERSISICRHYPFLLPAIYYRLSTGSYDNIVSFDSWLHAIQHSDELVERALAQFPHETTRMLRKGRLSWSWKRLRGLPSAEGYGLLFKQLSRMHAHLVVDVVELLRQNGLEDEGLILLDELLAAGEFLRSAAETPADGVMTFLRFLDNHRRSEAAHGFREMLLADARFYGSIARTPVNQTTSLLRYLDRRGSRHESERILTYLLSDTAFFATLERTPAGGIATFLKYVDAVLDREAAKKGRDELRAAKARLVRNLVSSEFFRSRIVAADDVVTLLKYFDAEGLHTETEEVVGSLIVSVAFRDTLARSPADKVAFLLRYLDSRKMYEARTQILTSLWERRSFWESMTSTPVDKLTTMLEYIDRLELEGISSDSILSRLRDDRWRSVLQTECGDRVRFLRYLDGRGLKVETIDILGMLWSVGSWRGLDDTTPEKARLFLRYVESMQ